jgi:hypothetical protein
LPGLLFSWLFSFSFFLNAPRLRTELRPMTQELKKQPHWH